jgi:DNA-binding GntR family transcriptional regulator
VGRLKDNEHTNASRYGSGKSIEPPMKRSRTRVQKAVSPDTKRNRLKVAGGQSARAALKGGSSLSSQAYNAIRERIVTLFFSPGQYLNEAAICDVLSLGRTPVHQALQRLQTEGMVEIVPRKGVIIQPDSVGQILDTIDARLVIEVELARRAAEACSDQDADDLQRILQIAKRRHGGGAIDAFVESDRALHGKIAQMSGNQVLEEFSRTLHERSTRFWYLHLWQTIDMAGSGDQHRSIVNAIKERNSSAAGNAMRSHISSLREKLIHIQRTAPMHGFHSLRR